ncbi:MAG: outer membrane protein insertion porin family, partial [Blastocatellia bacterium]|nr:outer membrane protein insertion porin family [Blastocatellia bacterium]
MHSYRVVWLAVLGLAITTSSFFVASRVRAQQPQVRVVEEVDVQGNRRLRKDDILYWIQTRPGDNYNPDQVARDLQAINGLGFFEKTETRVTVEEAPRGGVRVTFIVKELPIIRDIQFEGLKSVSES